MSSSLRVFVAVKRKKEQWVFLFPFPEDKEYKENSEQAWTVLVFFFPLTDPNSECLWLSLHFCPLTLQELHFTPIFLWLCAKYIPYLVFTPTTPFPLELHVSQRRPQSHPTARLNYWVTDASLWLSLKQCKRKESRSYQLRSSSLTPDSQPLPYKSP